MYYRFTTKNFQVFVYGFQDQRGITYVGEIKMGDFAAPVSNRVPIVPATMLTVTRDTTDPEVNRGGCRKTVQLLLSKARRHLAIMFDILWAAGRLRNIPRLEEAGKAIAVAAQKRAKATERSRQKRAAFHQLADDEQARQKARDRAARQAWRERNKEQINGYFREYRKNKMEAMTPEQHENYLKQQREYMRKYRARRRLENVS